MSHTFILLEAIRVPLRVVQLIALVGLLLTCPSVRLQAGEEVAQARYAYEDEESLTDSFDEEEERQVDSPTGRVFEEDLSSEEAAPYPPEEESRFPSVEEENPLFDQEQPFPAEAAPAPGETPPFLSRPREWETTPPTLAEPPPLPSPASFSERELVAFKFIEAGKESFDREEWDPAREQFERAVSLAPFLPYGYYFLGRIAFGQGDLKGALAFFQKAELLFPRQDRTWIGETASMKGTVHEELREYPQARAAYRRALRFQPANLKVLSALARLPEEELFPGDAISQ